MAICDSKLYFSRDVKVFIEPLDAAGTTQGEIWEIPVLDGFSFAQANNSSDITLSEMENTQGVSRRGKRMFNDSLAPAEWSFSTYTRPFVSAAGDRGTTEFDADTVANVHAVEEVLWALAAGKAIVSGYGWKGRDETSPIFTLTTPITGGAIPLEATNALTVTSGGTGFYPLSTAGLTYIVPGGNNDCVLTYEVDASGIIIAAEVTTAGTGYTELDGAVILPALQYEYFNLGLTSSSIDFRQSNTSALGTANIYFELSTDLTYKIAAAAVNEVTANFDIDGIAAFEWSGMGSEVTELGSTITATVREGISATDNFIRNRLTQLSVAPVKTLTDAGTYNLLQEAVLEDTYDLTLTGGSITISNNITYITPEELGIVNIPIGHVTGTRSISGSFTNYLVTDLITDKSADLWEDLKDTLLLPIVTHSFDLVFKVGGSTQTPRVEFAMGNCHIEIPTHSVEDVISLETNFTALGSCINAADELLITYVAA